MLGAPYGVYKTADHFLSLAMMDLQQLGEALGSEALKKYGPGDAFKKRDEIKALVAAKLRTGTTVYWLERLREKGLWASEIYNWNDLRQSEGYQVVRMEQQLQVGQKTITTTRCPIRLNGEKINSSKPAPALGQHRTAIIKELLED